MSINFTMLICPRCGSHLKEEYCHIDEKGYGHCLICDAVLFQDKPKKVKVVFT